MLRPEVAAQEARYKRYPTGNRAALALLDAEGNRRREALWQEVRG